MRVAGGGAGWLLRASNAARDRLRRKQKTKKPTWTDRNRGWSWISWSLLSCRDGKTGAEDDFFACPYHLLKKSGSGSEQARELNTGRGEKRAPLPSGSVAKRGGGRRT